MGPNEAVLILVELVVLCVLVGLVAYVIRQMAPPQEVRWLIWAIVLIFILIAVWRFFGGGHLG